MSATEAYLPHSRPDVGAAEESAVREAVSSGWLAQGPRVAALEAALAGMLRAEAGTDFGAAAVSSGTAAIYLALRALGVGEGDEVLMPAYGCAAILQAVTYTGATPSLVDCDPDTWNLDPADARRRLTRRSRALVVPHLFGLPADLDPLLELGPPVVEDCAHTLGARYRGRQVGTFGAAAVCSFHATKLLAAGEGGAVLSGAPGLLAQVRALRACEPAPAEASRPPGPGGATGPDRRWSFNFKMTDLQAAVASVQLQRLPEFLARRSDLAARYRQALADLPVRLPVEPRDRDHLYYRFVVTVDGDLVAILSRAEQRGLACRRPVGWLPGPVRAVLDELPGCRWAWERACSVPLYPALSDREAELVVERFRAAVTEAGVG